MSLSLSPFFFFFGGHYSKRALCLKAQIPTGFKSSIMLFSKAIWRQKSGLALVLSLEDHKVDYL